MAVAREQLKDVREDEAAGKIKVIYEDIKATLRVPFISRAFRLLANYPDAFQLLWSQLKPNAQTTYFESQADQLRRLAVEGLGRTSHTPGGAEEQKETLKTLQYVLPKLLLATAVMRAAVKGQYPRLEELPLEDKRQIATGEPDGMARIADVDISSADDRTRESLERLRLGLSVRTVPVSIAALSGWPAYLSSVEDDLVGLLEDTETRAGCIALERAAAEAALVMPFRVEANPHVLRRVGLTEDDIDSVQDILQSAYDVLPKLLLINSFLTAGAIGSGAAADSAFPPTTQ